MIAPVLPWLPRTFPILALLRIRRSLVEIADQNTMIARRILLDPPDDPVPEPADEPEPEMSIHY